MLDTKPNISLIVRRAFSALLGTAMCVIGASHTSALGSAPNGGWDGIWSPDGSRIAFVSQRPGEPPNLWVMPSAGGSARQLTSNGSRSFRWASDSKALYALTWRGGKNLWMRLPIAGAPSVAWPWMPAGASEPSPSPNGAQVAYLVRNKMWQDIWLAGPNGAGAHRITTDLYCERIMWSPDSKKIAFQAANPHIGWQTRAYIYDMSKKNSVHMRGLGTAVHSWSPDSKKLAFSMAKPPKGYVLGICDTATGAATSVAKVVHTGDGVEWSHDGQSLAITVARGRGTVINMVRANGTTVATIGGGKLSARFPSVSPDGTKVLFEAQTTGKSFGSELWIADSDGGDPNRLVNTYASDWAPTPAPNGSRVAFLSTRGGSCRVWVAAANGQGAKALGAADPGAKLLWSPNSAQLLVFQRRSSAVYPFSAGAIGRPLPISPIIPAASWSADSKKIIYTGNDQHRQSLLVYDCTRNIAKGLFAVAAQKTAADGYAIYSPDGRSIIFTRGKDLFVCDSTGKGARKVAPLAGNNDPQIGDISWAPTNDKVLVTLLNTGPAGSWFEMRVVTLAGRSVNILSDPVRSDFAAQRVAYTSAPQWMRDGKIRFSSDLGGTPQVWQMAPVAKSKPTKALAGTATFPATAADGRIYYVATNGSETTIYSTDARGQAARPWLKGK